LEIQGGSIRVDSTMRTNRPGVFAAGDVTTYPGKLKLIATAFGEAATAVNHAKQFTDPTAKLFPGHSSDMKRSL
jgi:thioredoxin reductase (NADPH)